MTPPESLHLTERQEALVMDRFRKEAAGGGCVVLVGAGARPCGKFPTNAAGICGRHVVMTLQRCPCGFVCELGVAWAAHRAFVHPGG